MNRIQEELKVIPRTAWVIAVAIYVAFVWLISFVLIPRDPKLSLWPDWGKAMFALGVSLFLLLYLLLVGYVNGDARRRGMHYVLWTLLAIFIPNAIGIILYFVLRDPPMRNCPKCGTTMRAGFVFCPACGTGVTQTCPECRHAVEPVWSHCPGCGKGLQAV
jgi:hypothetical protein